jgi:phage-related protein
MPVLTYIDRDKNFPIVIADVFQKTTQQTPGRVVVACTRRLAHYDLLTRED